MEEDKKDEWESVDFNKIHSMKSFQVATKLIENGVVHALLRIVQWALMGIFLVTIGRVVFDRWLPRDSTDTSDTRSGMKVHQDAQTGCQYLSTALGGLTPRLSEDGTPFCQKH